MANCRNCGREGTRVRTLFKEVRPGVLSHTEDECPGCKPGSFEPRWRTERGAMGWEAYPHMYRKITAPDGSVGYEAKDELRADTEARIEKPSEPDVQEAEAIARRKDFAANAPKRLTPAQIAQAKAYWQPKLRERATRRAAEERINQEGTYQ